MPRIVPDEFKGAGEPREIAIGELAGIALRKLRARGYRLRIDTYSFEIALCYGQSKPFVYWVNDPQPIEKAIEELVLWAAIMVL